jgi:diphosphomevalonate decarboxylase
MLMHPNTLRILNATRKYREVKKVPVYFSLDAGPNVHLLYPDSVKEEVNEWIGSELSTYCKGGKVIYDHGGDGPEEL